MSPVLRFFWIELPAFGTMLAIGFALVHLLLFVQARRFGYSFGKLHSLTLVAFLGGSLGARLFDMLIVQKSFSLSAFFHISEGTFFYGFLLGLFISCGIYYKFFSSDDPWKELDIAVPAWLVLQFCGRIGCFLAGCCFGTHTDLPWGVAYHAELSQAPQDIMLHPTQLYEAAAILLILVYTFSNRVNNIRRGTIFLRTVLLYAVARFFLEFLRGDERGTLLGGALSTSQGISLILVTAVIILLWRIRFIRRPSPRPAFQQTTIQH